MKKVFLIIGIFMSISAFSQVVVPTEIIEDKKPVLHNQFRDYVEFRKQHQFRPEHFPMHPKPERVIVKRNKVIVIFNREDFQRLRPMMIEKERIIWKERPKGKFQRFFDERMSN